MIPTTPKEETWGYLWRCPTCGWTANKAKPSDAPKCPKCKKQMTHQPRSSPRTP